MFAALALNLLAASSAALAVDGARGHYDEAKHCHLAAMTLALLASKQSNYLPDNSKYGREVGNRYLPVIAFEGHKLGMSYEAIISDLRTSYETYATKIVAELNAGKKSQQMARYNEIVAAVRACAEVPAIAQASE